VATHITKDQLNALASSVSTTRQQLDAERSHLTPQIWSGPDADRFHAHWESSVTANLNAAANAIFKIDLEKL
jgi:hypothetical protein